MCEDGYDATRNDYISREEFEMSIRAMGLPPGQERLIRECCEELFGNGNKQLVGTFCLKYFSKFIKVRQHEQF